MNINYYSKKLHNTRSLLGVLKMNFYKILVVSMLFMAFNASAANMTDVEFNSLPGGKVEMRFMFDKGIKQPDIYTIESPARIALDLEGVGSKLKQKKHTLDLGNAQSVMVLESGGRTRVIVNLIELTKYDSYIEGNDLYVVVGNDAVRDYLKESPSQLEEKIQKETISSLGSIDFRRGDDGEGRLLVELTNPKIDVDSRVEGRFIKLSFIDTDLPESLQLEYDVSDFATPVKSVRAYYEDGVAHIDIEPIGEYEYLAYQAENKYVLTVKPLTEEEIEAKNREFSYVGDKLSLNFQDIDVRAVLQLIADFTDLNLVASDTVEGKITLRLENVPWDQALELILKTKGLDKRQEGNVLMVAPAVEIAEREQQEIQTNRQLEELAPLQTEFIRIRYANAGEIFALLKGDAAAPTGDDGPSAAASGSVLSPRASVIVDGRTNSLLVTETAQNLEEIRQLINLIDVPIRQVLVEARVVTASSTASDALGIQWGGAVLRNAVTNGNRATSGTVISGNQETFLDVVNAEDQIDYFRTVDLGVGVPGATNLNIGFIKQSRVLDFQISAIETAGQGEVVAQPKIITGDKQNAKITSGTQIPFQERSLSGGTVTRFIDAALILDVTPSITPDDKILMDLKINQDRVGELTASGIPTIDTNRLETQVLVGNGETVVLGGVFTTLETENETKTPFLGDIPYLGRLFKRTSRSVDNGEILIFITPRILADTLVD